MKNILGFIRGAAKTALPAIQTVREIIQNKKAEGLSKTQPHNWYSIVGQILMTAVVITAIIKGIPFEKILPVWESIKVVFGF